MNRHRYFSTERLAVIGLMAAMVFVATYFLHIDIPTPLGKTMLHFGNVMCVLSGLLFGGLTGGLAAGIGSAIYDLMDPAFAPEFWITFILKFAMAFIAGTLAGRGGARHAKPPRLIAAAIVGAVNYTALYIGKTIIVEYFVMRAEWATVWTVVVTKGSVSLFNAALAAAVSAVLAIALRPALERAGVYRRLDGERQ